jgi:hypothetical protein
MNWIDGIKTSVSTAMSGVKWQLALYRLGFIVLILVGTFFGGVLWEKDNQKDKQIAAEKVKVQEVITFLPVISDQEKEASELRVTVLTKQGRYNEAVDKSNSPPSCNLSDDELRNIQDLAR